MKAFFALVLLISLPFVSFSTHIRGGEISYEVIQPATRTVKITLLLYRDSGPGSVDQPYAYLSPGDGSSCLYSKVIARESVAVETEVLTFEFQHVYGADGKYLISFNEENRNANIVNIDNGNSVNISFYINAFITIDAFNLNTNSFLPLKSSPLGAIVGEEYSFTPAGYELDGDSIAYKLVKPLAMPIAASNCEGHPSPATVPFYFLPDSAYINPFSGNLRWTPSKQGNYTFTIEILEYRNGELIGYQLKDFMIQVVDEKATLNLERTDHNILKKYNVLNINENESLNLKVRISDEDAEKIDLKAYSELLVKNFGVLEIKDSASYKVATYTIPANEILKRKQPYIFTFRGISLSPARSFQKDFTYIINTSPDQTFEFTGETSPEAPPLGTDHEIYSLSIPVYPNPAKEEFYINATGIYNPVIKIFNSAGKLLIKQSAAASPIIKLNRGDLAPGVYLLSIESKDKRKGWGKLVLE